LARDSR